jgi:hypothetical protein
MREMSREFAYPVVTEVRRAGALAPLTTRYGFKRQWSQRELVQASLLRCPDRIEVRRALSEQRAS